MILLWEWKRKVIHQFIWKSANTEGKRQKKNKFIEDWLESGSQSESDSELEEKLKSDFDFDFK